MPWSQLKLNFNISANVNMAFLLIWKLFPIWFIYIYEGYHPNNAKIPVEVN